MSSDTTKVRIGFEAARELEIDVEDGDAVASDIESAIKKGSGLLWVTDAKGDRHGLAVAKVAFVQVEGSLLPGLGR